MAYLNGKPPERWARRGASSGASHRTTLTLRPYNDDFLKATLEMQAAPAPRGPAEHIIRVKRIDCMERI